MKYCVYLHKNPITKEVFYIGSGNEKRPYHFASRGAHWQKYVIDNGLPIIEIYRFLDTKEESISLEIELISKYKRICDGGCLINKSIGGAGPVGYSQSDSAKQKIGASRKHFVYSDEIKSKISQSVKKYFNSIEARTKLSLGIKRSKLFQEKMKIVNSNKKKIILDTQTGIYYIGLKEAADAYNVNKVTLGCKLNGADRNNTSLIYV